MRAVLWGLCTASLPAAAAAAVYSAGQCLHTTCCVAAGGQALNPALIRCDCLQDAAKDLPPSAVEDLEVGQGSEQY